MLAEDDALYVLHRRNLTRISFGKGAQAADRYIVTNRFPGLKFNVVYGPKLTEVLNRYTGYTGRPPLPPAWSFAPWLSSDI